MASFKGKQAIAVRYESLIGELVLRRRVGSNALGLWHSVLLGVSGA